MESVQKLRSEELHAKLKSFHKQIQKVLEIIDRYNNNRARAHIYDLAKTYKDQLKELYICDVFMPEEIKNTLETIRNDHKQHSLVWPSRKELFSGKWIDEDYSDYCTQLAMQEGALEKEKSSKGIVKVEGIQFLKNCIDSFFEKNPTEQNFFYQSWKTIFVKV